MLKINFLFALFCVSALGFSQEVEVKYDKHHDFSVYKTFSVGEGEIFTPKAEREFDEVDLKGWIREAIIRELTTKGFRHVDAAGDLHIDFVAGSIQQAKFEDWGPLGHSQVSDPTGIGSSRTWSEKHNQGSLFLDVIDLKEKTMVWSSTATVNIIGGKEIQRLIAEVVMKSFKKLSSKPKKKKK